MYIFLDTFLRAVCDGFTMLILFSCTFEILISPLNGLVLAGK